MIEIPIRDKSYSNERMLRIIFQAELSASSFIGRGILSEEGTVWREFGGGDFKLG